MAKMNGQLSWEIGVRTLIPSVEGKMARANSANTPRRVIDVIVCLILKLLLELRGADSIGLLTRVPIMKARTIWNSGGRTDRRATSA